MPMNPRVRSVLGVVAGVVVAALVTAAIEWLGGRLHPMPVTVDPSDPSDMAAWVETLPTGAFMIVLAAWLAGTFVGGLVASLVARTRPLFHSGIVGVFILAATIANFVMIPHPTWLVATAVVCIPLAAWLASRVAISFGVPAGSARTPGTAQP